MPSVDALSAVVDEDLPLEYLRLLQQRLPEHFAGLVVRLEADVRLGAAAKARMRARVVALAEEG